VTRPKAALFGLSAAAVALAVVVALPASHGEAAPAEPPIMVVDLHVDVPYQVHFKGRSPALREGHSSPALLSAGGYGGIVFPIYMHPVHKDGAHIEDADGILASIEKIVAKNDIFLPLGAKEAQPGKIASFLSIEGAGAFSKDISRIDYFIDRGVRLIGPVHSANNDLASSATGKKIDHGFTPLGKEFCERVYRRGALIDVSHLSDSGFSDLIPIARAHGAPIVATHSNARAVAAHPRNLTDDQLRAIKESGGVAGLNFHSPFVTTKEKATTADVIAQLEHMVRVAGVDHVAIGSDYDGGITPAEGLEDASTFPRFAAALRKRGMAREDILKIFSLNALRVLAWRPPKTEGPSVVPAAPPVPPAPPAPTPKG
jgi:membrane dipeptidase